MSLLLEFFGRLHPMLLHLPIGMLCALGIYEFRAWRKGDPPAPRFWVSLAAACAAFAAGSGWQLHQEPGYVENFALEWHERLGIATGLSAILCAMLYNNVTRYRKVLLLSVATMLGAGHYGGTMTHGEDFIFEPLLRLAANNESQPPASVVSLREILRLFSKPNARSVTARASRKVAYVWTHPNGYSRAAKTTEPQSMSGILMATLFLKESC